MSRWNLGRLMAPGVLACALVGGLSACGGGSSSPTQANNQGTPSAGGGSAWTMTTLSSSAMAIVPGAGYVLGGETPTVDWLNDDGDGRFSMRQTSLSGTGAWLPASTRMTGVQGLARINDTIMSTAGAWTMLVWARDGNLWVQLAGPGVNSLPVNVATNFNRAGWDTLPVVDASGHARLYWPDGTTGSLMGGHFDGTRWVADTVTDALYLPGLQQREVGPDGQGWLLYAGGSPLPYGAPQHFMRMVSAQAGLGPEIRIDEPRLGFANTMRLTHAASVSSATSVTVYDEGRPSACVAVTNLYVAARSDALCVNGSVVGSAVSGHQVALHSEAGGRAIVVWTGGVDDAQLYAAVRHADGTWSSPSLIATESKEAYAPQFYYSVVPRVHASGRGVVVYRVARQLAGQSGARLEARAVMLDPVSGTWSASTVVEPESGQSSGQLTVAFDSIGNPAVLDFMGPSKNASVVFSNWRDGTWRSQVLSQDVNLTGTDFADFTFILSTQRLVPLSGGKWAAFWEEGATRKLIGALSP